MTWEALQLPPSQLYPALTSRSCASPEAMLASQSWIQVFQSDLTEDGVNTARKNAYCLKTALNMTRVGLVCSARTVLQIMVSYFSANALYGVVSTSLPQDPELPVQLSVLHWRKDLPHTLAFSFWELSKLFCKQHPIADLVVPKSWLCSALLWGLHCKLAKGRGERWDIFT